MMFSADESDLMLLRSAVNRHLRVARASLTRARDKGHRSAIEIGEREVPALIGLKARLNQALRQERKGP